MGMISLLSILSVSIFVPYMKKEIEDFALFWIQNENYYEEERVRITEQNDPRYNILNLCTTEKLQGVQKRETNKQGQNGGAYIVSEHSYKVIKTISCTKPNEVFFLRIKNIPKLPYSIGIMAEDGETKFYKTMELFRNLRIVLPEKGEYQIIMRNENPACFYIKEQ